jgi:hypothetical protein
MLGVAVVNFGPAPINWDHGNTFMQAHLPNGTDRCRGLNGSALGGLNES